MNGHDDIVRLLLKAGADPTTKAEVGTTGHAATALEAAQERGHITIVELLKAAGARE